MAVVRMLRGPARRISTASRRRKLAALTSWIEPGANVLAVGVSADPGVGTESMVERGLAGHASVVALVYPPVDQPVLGRATVRGDARALPFRDGSFDYVVSNAVIEHLGGPAGAKAFLEESERVARRGWVHTTPNRRFPLEVHTGVPLAHWLPRRPREWLFARLGKPFPTSHTFLFTGRSLRRLGVPVTVSPATGRWPAMTLFATSTSLEPPRLHEPTPPALEHREDQVVDVR